MTEWPQWSKSFGLVENEHKVAVVSRHQPWEEELLTLGFEVGQMRACSESISIPRGISARRPPAKFV